MERCLFQGNGPPSHVLSGAVHMGVVGLSYVIFKPIELDQEHPGTLIRPICWIPRYYGLICGVPAKDGGVVLGSGQTGPSGIMLAKCFYDCVALA